MTLSGTVTASATASVTPLDREPTTADTLSLSTSWRAASTAAVGEVWESACLRTMS